MQTVIPTYICFIYFRFKGVWLTEIRPLSLWWQVELYVALHIVALTATRQHYQNKMQTREHAPSRFSSCPPSN